VGATGVERDERWLECFGKPNVLKVLGQGRPLCRGERLDEV
jgi:hypothetical protein